MKRVHFLQIGLVLLTLALLTAPVALAQTEVQTRLELTTEDEEETREWDGGDLEIQLQARLCWDSAGGINPEDEEFNLTVQADPVEGANTTVDPENITIAPPSGPTDDTGCTEAQDITLTLEAGEGLQANQTLNVTVTITETEGEPAGTFQAPENGSASVEVRTTEDFDPEDPGGPLDPGDGDEEGTPAPGAVVLLAVLGLLIAHRRRACRD